MRKIFIILIIFFSCKGKINNLKRFEYFKINNDTVYSNRIHKIIYDSLNKWIDKGLKNYSFNDDKDSKVMLSKYIFFNSKKNKLVARIPLQSICESCVMDHIPTILGQKIDSVWWFYGGESYAILREWYTSEIHKPLSFQKLEEIGIDETMNWYYYQKHTPLWKCLNFIFDTKKFSECYKTKLIINDKYFDKYNWECIHENYLE